MPTFGPISRRNLIRALQALGFEGPFPGGNHMVMRLGSTRVTIPNPHSGDISTALLARILKEAGITRDAWEKV
jgi:predicted RNA binding protein YcfA (HicA-like mRNA interferase family)